MDLKNITLKTAELGPVEWNNVEKLQPSDDGFIFFVSYDSYTITEDESEVTYLTGKYIQTDFTEKPSYKEIINFIIQKEYPNGKESQMLRLGVQDPENQEYLEYFNDVEDICSIVKGLLT